MHRGRLTVAVLGLRGFPNIQGGVEKHAEQLYPRLAAMGCDVRVLGRSPYRTTNHSSSWKNVRFTWLWAPEIRGIESLVHSLFAVVAAARHRPDIVHIHAIGPSLVAPLARLLGMKVVVTHHGKDYERQKWGRFAKRLLRLGERVGMRSANERIAISHVIRDSVHGMYGVDSVVIPNGIEHVGTVEHSDVLQRFGLEPGKYVLQVSRLVPEKRQLDLIAAFAAAKLPASWKLAIVGDTEFPDEYSRSVKVCAAAYPNVICTGFQGGADLRALYRHAGLFVLPSSHEGLPIALLEAVSHCVPVAASDIPANREVGLSPSNYFPVGDVAGLTRRIEQLTHHPPSRAELESIHDGMKARFNWDSIARETLAVYQRAADAKS